MFEQTDRSMKVSRFTSFFTLLLIFFFPVLTSARHIIGGEITYAFLNRTNTTINYRFTMTLYRDCGGTGADFDDNAEFAIYQGSLTSATRIATFRVPLSVQSVRVPIDTPKCVSEVPSVCVERGTYVFNRTLNISTSQSYFIVYQRCCRNNTISNIVNPGDVGATFLIEITPAAMAVDNNSPTFRKFPPIVICNTIPVDFDHGATDINGDQLSYSFCSPLAGGGPVLNSPGVNSCNGAVPVPPCGPDSWNNVPFRVPQYTPERPMGGDPEIQINPQTGLITGRPNRLGQFVVGVCVSEFRNGQLLSVIRREFQFNVADCKPKVVANIDSDTTFGSRSFVLSSCGDNTVTFKNESLDRRFITKFEWQFNFKNGRFVNDKDWDPTISFPDTGFYKGLLVLNPGVPCADTAEIRVNIFPSVKADFSYTYDTCIAGPVVFKDLSTGAAGVRRWFWSFDRGAGTSEEREPSHQFRTPGLKPVRLRVTDRNNCAHDTTQDIRWLPAPPLIILRPNTFLGCKPANITFTNLSSPIDTTYKIEWDFGDGTTLKNVISPTHKYEKPGVYDIKIRITSPIGCTVADTFPQLIRVEESPKADFVFDPNENLSNFNNTVRFTDQSTNANRWNWTFDDLGRSSVQNPVFTFQDTGLMTVRLIVTHPRGCQDSITKILDIVPKITWYMPNAFTPNNDGANEGFLGKGILDGVTDFNMTVWNRWGEKVYETNSHEESWNGRRMSVGDLSPAGVYTYIVTFTAPRGERKSYKGFATLVR
jgi:gliding motility-associated-like protein